MHERGEGLQIFPLAARPVYLAYRCIGGALVGILAAAAALVGGVSASQETAPSDTSFTKQVMPALQQYCMRCHAEKGAGGVDLTQYPNLSALQRNPDVWRKVVRQLRSRTMPPPGASQPSAEQRQQLADWVSAALDKTDN